MSTSHQYGQALDALDSLEARYQEARRERDESCESAKKALDVIESYGGIDGEHHKAWVIDQVVRALMESLVHGGAPGDAYLAWVKDAKSGEDGPDTYSWDEGIAP